MFTILPQSARKFPAYTVATRHAGGARSEPARSELMGGSCSVGK